MRIGWLVVLAACGGDGGGAVDAPTPSGDVSPDACSASARTIFVNRGGGTYTKGTTDDAVTNTSSALDMTRTIPPPTVVDADWTAVKQCLVSKLAPFAVTLTDQDPSPMPHIEVVIIDNGNQIGIPGLVNGAPATPCVGGFGTAATNTIAYAAWLGDNFNRCWDVAQAIGYTLGLDNVLPCADLMSQNPTGCSIAAKAFTNVDQPCGDAGGARACRCGGTMQNAAARITANVGAGCM